MADLLTLDQVHVGDALPTLSYDVSATTVVLGALATRDWRPMHHDHDFAVNRNGTKDIFLNTPNQAAWFERYVTDWTGPRGRLGRMTFRMKGSVFPDDTMHLDATVQGVGTDDDRLRLGRPARVAHRRRGPQDRLHRPRRPPARSRRQPLAPPRRPVDPLGAPMDLDFSDEQEMLREMTRGVCADFASLDVVRELEDDPVGYPDAFWKQLAGLDLIGLTLPAAYGGSEMTTLEAAIVYDELGRSLAPSPHFASAVMSAGVLVAAGTDEQKQAWLPRIASGESILVPAWIEPHHGFGPDGVQMEARADGDGYVLDGVKWHVPFASSAERIVVLARTADGVDLFLVDPSSAGVTLDQQMTIASDSQYAVTFDGVRVATGDRIGAAGSGWATWSEVMNDGMILQAAQAMGGARHALDVTVQYAKDREQFDKPLGAFQALAHYMADAKTSVDGATLLVYEAAWARANGRPVDRLAPMAKLFATQTYRDVTAMAQQIFGGVGFTVEYEIQLYFRRAKQMQISWYDSRRLEDLIAVAVLD